MIKNWKPVRLRLQMRTIMVFLVILSFDSLETEGISMTKDLQADRDAADLGAVSFHRKLLGRFRNPYTHLNAYKDHGPVASVRPPSSSVVPSHKSKTSRSSAMHPPRISPPALHVSSAPSPSVTTLSNVPTLKRSSSNSIAPIVVGCTGGVLLLLLASGVFLFKSKAGKSVNPWRTGLSGQLQKVFITGVPKLKRSEIEAACEEFSNVIGSCPIGTLFKGTLSSGVEIAVASVATASAKEWTNNIEMQFRKKIEMLSKINHKNFVNLLGYCEEDEPFTRILVFEYASNGSVFEHLHYKESEHLDWLMRLRIAMGVAYCLDHMHDLKPPIVHSNLLSSTLHLTEDYAVKIADFNFGYLKGPSERETSTNTTKEDNVHSFGLLLFELITGKLPESVVKKGDSVDTGLADFLRGKTLEEMVDPTLECFDDNKIENIGEVIKRCVREDTKERPTMKEVTGRLREISGLSTEDAIPKLSPLWWAELEVLSTA
ncbi:putative inactive receptor-like protein kinase [Raphanus sativus]|uniref:Probable inactive receptor-like protein kinase At3g56050 n=1 Tax=Raphanus sativus TaxID=3726 RepID=A0A6J0NML9_RAPSA|nr:probable inactive receptor-like protein kinase At3g56050 [Raphanus sativus]KAJ4904654.1 putative inactive receptor-like protein kinase [Raphanus sativus]